MTATDNATKLRAGLVHEDADVRLKAALTAGTYPDVEFIEMLLERCGVEEDFFVRDMLTWALIHHPVDALLPHLRVDLGSTYNAARGQALHTISKIGAPEAWGWITPDHLHDDDDAVARPAWRAAVATVPEEEADSLAAELLQQLGRSDHDAMRGLAQAFVALGAKYRDDEDTPSFIEPLLEDAARNHPKPVGRAHAEAILRLHRDPTTPFSLTAPDGAETE